MPYYEALPKTLKPHHYDLSISEIDAEKETFTGVVRIHLSVESSTDELHLNYRDLTVYQDKISIVASGINGSLDVKVTSISEIKEKEYFVIKFAETVDASKFTDLLVTLTYNGLIQNNMAGFYKSTYTEQGEEKFMLSTQFEATDARRAFPCLDEPELKATFSVDLTVPKEWVTLGNMPIAQETASGALKVVTFEKTPIMSSYLLAWACGDFEYIESHTEGLYVDNKPLPVRIYTTKGYTAEAEFALEIAPKIVDYFSKIFEVKYPLPKLDLIAVHAFSHNAMENWGLITYRSTALLFSDEKSDPLYKQKVCYVVAHEIAHQWFGNLVTMKWWDELWLNEGFATWVGFAAVDFLFPEWDIFSGFVSESLQQALNLDGLRNSHPIEVPVIDALDIDQVFDAISYLKGASTILMLSNYLGQSVFLQGVAKYLNKNKFGNATSNDLWSSIEDVSGKPISSLMESWIKKIGFPVVNVDVNSDKGLKISQSRFLNGGDVTSEDDETKWWIPLNFSTGPEHKDVFTDVKPLAEKETTIENFPLLDKFFKLNKDTTGVYRVNYSPQILEQNILPYFNKLSATDKVGLIADVFSIAVSGNEFTSTATLLNLIKSLVDSDALGDDYVVWLELGNRLSTVLTTFSGVDASLTESLHHFAQYVYNKKAISVLGDLKIKEDSSSTKSHLKGKLQREILSHAGLLSIAGVKEYAQELFDAWKSGETIDPSLRYFVISTIASSPELMDEKKFGLIMTDVIAPTSLDSREITLAALGHLKTPEFATKMIGYLVEPEVVPTMDAHFLGKNLSLNIQVRDEFWKYFKNNYDSFYNLMSTNMVVLDRFVKWTLGNYQTKEMHDEIEQFFSDKDVHGFERSYKQVLDNIKIRAAWLERDQASVVEWLKLNGF